MQNQTLLAEMMDYCFERNIEYITELIDYAAQNRNDWSRFLSESCNYAKMTEFLQNHSER